jgi:3-deoxy-D-manno-octulosonate 8-phosphate phosphatase (KDO 8-P phosphatase)
MPDPRTLREISVLLLDVDGVLTDGRIIYNSDGSEIKAFHVKDGLGIRMAQKAGIRVGIVTGRASRALRHRCENLGIETVCDGVRDKAAAVDRILRKFGMRPEVAAFMGDDLPDLPAMRRVGCPVAVADAHSEVRAAACWVTRAGGGIGAVREVCEALIQARGVWQALKTEMGFDER